jgi:hypothetical protein
MGAGWREWEIEIKGRGGERERRTLGPGMEKGIDGDWGAWDGESDRWRLGGLGWREGEIAIGE